MRSTMLSENQYEKKFIPTAMMSMMVMPVCPPNTPPRATISAIRSAMSIVVFSVFIASFLLYLSNLCPFDYIIQCIYGKRLKSSQGIADKGYAKPAALILSAFP